MGNRSQVMSALIKAIRLRRDEEAVMWLLALQKLTNDFHICRRIVISAAEDNVQPEVMLKASRLIQGVIPGAHHESYQMRMIAEVLRICDTKNWYATEVGRDFIYQFRLQHEKQLMVGKTFKQCLCRVITGIRKGNVETAFEGMYSLVGKMESITDAWETVSTLKFLMGGHQSAKLKLGVYSDCIQTIWKDENFLGQVVYELATGKSLSEESCPVIMRSQVMAVLKKVGQRSERVPKYYLDGIHVAGKDRRFAGIHEAMRGMCKAFMEFGRVHPDDIWPGYFWVL